MLILNETDRRDLERILRAFASQMSNTSNKNKTTRQMNDMRLCRRLANKIKRNDTKTKK